MPWWYRGDAVHLVAGPKADVVKDLSGNGHDSLQATDANRWAWSATSGPNGTPGLTGTGTQFSVTAGNVDLSAATKITIIFVMTPGVLDAGGTDTVVSNQSGVSNLGIDMESFESGTDSFEIFAASPPINPPFSITQSTNPAPARSPVIVEASCDQSLVTNQGEVWINGILNAQARPANGQSTGGFQSLPLNLGKNINVPTQCLKGVLADCFAYIGLLTAQQRQNLYRGYLGPRYGIVVP